MVKMIFGAKQEFEQLSMKDVIAKYSMMDRAMSKIKNREISGRKSKNSTSFYLFICAQLWHSNVLFFGKMIVSSQL